MKISREGFEKAVEVAYLEGTKAQLSEMILPKERSHRLQSTILKAYACLPDTPEKSLKFENGSTISFTEGSGEEFVGIDVRT
jgi:hypothetical protein